MDFSILVGSCDKYEFVWKKFLKRFDKFWDHSIDVPRYFQTETKEVPSDRFKTINSGVVSFSDMMYNSLNQIETDYVLWLQDDYYLVRSIAKSEFEKYFEFIHNNNVDRFGIQPDSSLYSHSHISGNIFKFNKNSQYSLSLQSSIWNRKFLMNFIKNSPPESPWQFEINGTRRLNQLNHNIYFENLKEKWYLEAVTKGKKNQIYFEDVI